MYNGYIKDYSILTVGKVMTFRKAHELQESCSV